MASFKASYGYDNNHQVLFRTNALGEVTSYTYNATEQVTSITLPNGLVTTNLYGNNGFLAQQIVVGFSTNSYTYTNGLVYTHTDERGLTTTNTWDALQRLTQVAYPDGTSISYTYELFGPGPSGGSDGVHYFLRLQFHPPENRRNQCLGQCDTL